MSIEHIYVKYMVKQEYCNCCNQKLPHPKASDEKIFRIREDILMKEGDWVSISKYEEDFDDAVEEYVYDAIHFFCDVKTDDILLIDIGEILKVKNRIIKLMDDSNV